MPNPKWSYLPQLWKTARYQKNRGRRNAMEEPWGKLRCEVKELSCFSGQSLATLSIGTVGKEFRVQSRAGEVWVRGEKIVCWAIQVDEDTSKWIPEVEHQELELQILTLVRWEMLGEVAWTLHRTCIPHNQFPGSSVPTHKGFRQKRELCQHKTQLHYAWAVGFPLLPAPLDSYQEAWKLHIPNEKQKIFIIKSELFKCILLLAGFKVCFSDPHATKPTQGRWWWSSSGWGWWHKTSTGSAFCCLQGCWFTYKGNFCPQRLTVAS